MSSSAGPSISHDIIEEKPEAQVTSSERDLDASGEKKPGDGSSSSDDKNLTGSDFGTVEEEESKHLSGQARALLALSLALVVFIVGMVRLSTRLTTYMILI